MATDQKPVLAEIMYVHADINVGNKIAACEALKLVSLRERVYGSDDHVRGFQLVCASLPAITNGNDPRSGLKAADKPLGNACLSRFTIDTVECATNETIKAAQKPLDDARLGRSTVDIGQRAANKAIGVCRIDYLGVYVDVPTDAHMRSLLYYVRPAPAEANDADGCGLYDRVAVSSEETLAIEPAHAVLHLRRGTPTSIKEVMK